MRTTLFLAAAGLALAAGPALALGSQSSNTSSNSSSNNGHVRERIVESYCEDGYCERRIISRSYRDDRQRRRRGDRDRRWRERWDDDRGG